MFSIVEEKFEEIVDIFKELNLSTKKIEKAYNFAKEKHNGVLRKDGSPYILHPVEVALILAKLNFDEDVICGALLHDVVEDCGVTLEEIESEFSSDVRDLVDGVSAIDKQNYNINSEDIFEDVNFIKASIEEQSFKKLIAIGKLNPRAFCIKFADRLHNLKTIDIFDYNKQLEKVKETEKWILPLAKILKTNYFYEEIKNECFKIKNKKYYSSFLDEYKFYHEINKPKVAEISKTIYQTLSEKCLNFIVEDVKEYKIYESLQEISKNINISVISQGQILRVANYNIFFIYEDNYSEILNNIVNTILNSVNNLSIIDINIDEISKKTYFVLQDYYKNKYNFFVLTQQEYSSIKTGSLSNIFSDVIDDEELDSLNKELIKVKTRSGEIKYVQKDSTVLDFAFKIHRDIGYGFKYAIINSSKTKIPPYTKLYENDKVEIVVERDNNGNIVKNPQLKWFAYVNTEFAKKCLIKYFESKE